MEYKLATVTHKAVHGLLPSYLAGDCLLVTATGRRQLSLRTFPHLWSIARPRISVTGASDVLQHRSGTDFHRR